MSDTSDRVKSGLVIGPQVGGLAEVAIAQHRGADALEFAERVVRISEAAAVPVGELATARFSLARAVVAAGGDDARAIALVEQARAVFREDSTGRRGVVARRDAVIDVLPADPTRYDPIAAIRLVSRASCCASACWVAAGAPS